MRKKKPTKVDKAWVQGFACAAAISARLEGLPTDTLVREGGFNRKYLEEHEVEPADIAAIYDPHEYFD